MTIIKPGILPKNKPLSSYFMRGKCRNCGVKVEVNSIDDSPHLYCICGQWVLSMCPTAGCKKVIYLKKSLWSSILEVMENSR